MLKSVIITCISSIKVSKISCCPSAFQPEPESDSKKWSDIWPTGTGRYLVQSLVGTIPCKTRNDVTAFSTLTSWHFCDSCSRIGSELSAYSSDVTKLVKIRISLMQIRICWMRILTWLSKFVECACKCKCNCCFISILVISWNAVHWFMSIKWLWQYVASWCQ